MFFVWINQLTVRTGHDTVVACSGRNVILDQINQLKWAEETPCIKRFFPSEYGTDIEYNTTTSPSEIPHQLKLKVRAFIRENIKRLSYTYVVTGPYPEMAFNMVGGTPQAGGFNVKERKASLLGDPDKSKVSYTSMPE